jgi:hypothetical protein
MRKRFPSPLGTEARLDLSTSSSKFAEKLPPGARQGGSAGARYRELRELRSIGYTESLGAKLQDEPFGDRKVAEHASIEIEESRPTENIAPGITEAFRADRRASSGELTIGGLWQSFK